MGVRGGGGGLITRGVGRGNSFGEVRPKPRISSREKVSTRGRCHGLLAMT